METVIRTQKETIIELEARIQANTEEIGKVHIIRWSILAGRMIASSPGAGYQASRMTVTGMVLSECKLLIPDLHIHTP